jgi:hypothetical protein
MIAWIIGLVTIILALLVLWQKSSAKFRERAEEPKYLFLESLGIRASRSRQSAQSNSSQEDNDESAHP